MSERRFKIGTLESGSNEAILYDGLDEAFQRLDGHLAEQDRAIERLERQLAQVHQWVAWLVQREQAR